MLSEGRLDDGNETQQTKKTIDFFLMKQDIYPANTQLHLQTKEILNPFPDRLSHSHQRPRTICFSSIYHSARMGFELMAT